jgi:hypothetical protein
MSDTDRVLFRLGGVSCVAGAVITFAGQALHPPIWKAVGPDEMLAMVAGSAGWIEIHLAIMAGGLLMVLGLSAFQRSLPEGKAAALGRMAGVTVLLAGASLMALSGIDGVATKSVAGDWAAAAGADRTALVHLGAALIATNVALAMVLMICLQGLTFLLLGLAVALGGGYPRWMGWFGAAAGSAALPLAVTALLRGSQAVPPALFASVGALSVIWTVLAGVLLYRRARS